MAKLPFALQLYSIREPLARDIHATLRRVREIGYDHVELAGTAGQSATEFRQALDAAGLTAISAHVAYTDCRANLERAIADCGTLGVSWAAIPWLDPAENRTLEDWVTRAREMEEFGAAFKAAGIQLCYHNHAHELEQIGEKTVFEIIFEHATADLLAVELDSGWAHYGGANPAALIHAYAGRVPLVHIKDVKRRVEGEPPHITELGSGATHFASVFKAAGECGVSWLIVEQDESTRDPLESARMNAAYMRVNVF